MSQKTKLSFRKLDELKNKAAAKNSGAELNSQNKTKTSKNKTVDTDKSFTSEEKGMSAQTDESLKNQKNKSDKENPKVINKRKSEANSSDDASVELLKTQMEVLSQEKDDWKNRTVRLSADLQNLQKQSEIDKNNAKKTTKKSLSKNLLSFLNTMHLAFVHTPEGDEKVTKFVDTLKASFNQLIRDLEKEGVEIIIPKIGDSFDPNIMYSLNSAEEMDDLEIKQVVGLGIKIDEQVVQSATVMV